MQHRSAPYRESNFAPRRVTVDRREDGVILIRSPVEVGPVERSVCDFLPKWAEASPDRMFLAERLPDGSWRKLTYADVWRGVRGLGSALIERGIGSGARIAILSGNSIDHALVMLAAMSIGAAAASISPNYSLLDGGQARLRDIGDVLKPDAVFVQSCTAFARAFDVPAFRDALRLSAQPSSDALQVSALAETSPSEAFDAAFAAITPDTIAKILFTSGSTGSPKGVINTHGMLSAVLGMTAALGQPRESPPVHLEWLPWHHTMGGNATFNGVLREGGELYIDDGRPVPQLFHKTIANLREISPTSMLNVPAGYAMLAEALETDDALRERFFMQLERLTYGGATLPEDVLDRLQAQSVRATGKRTPVTCGYGLTETAPTVAITHWASEISGELGLPIPGLSMKLAPVADGYELRVKAPSVTPGYLGRPDLTEAAFDEEGYYRTGDTVDFIDRNDPAQGLRFVGRLSENFKLSTGTWVSVGELRLALMNATHGLLRDVVVAGENRASLAILAWAADPSRTRDPAFKASIAEALMHHNARAGASARISAFRLLDEAPSLGDGEITDKAYVNQRAVLRRRSADVDALFARPAPEEVVILP